jgi:hypothetical protein
MEDKRVSYSAWLERFSLEKTSNGAGSPQTDSSSWVEMMDTPKLDTIAVTIYVAKHCEMCAYAYEIADLIRMNFPEVAVRLVDMETTSEEIPENVFATPTYLLNGLVWSLGNPSREQVRETLSNLLQAWRTGEYRA